MKHNSDCPTGFCDCGDCPNHLAGSCQYDEFQESYNDMLDKELITLEVS